MRRGPASRAAMIESIFQTRGGPRGWAGERFRRSAKSSVGTGTLTQTGAGARGRGGRLGGSRLAACCTAQQPGRDGQGAGLACRDQMERRCRARKGRHCPDGGGWPGSLRRASCPARCGKSRRGMAMTGSRSWTARRAPRQDGPPARQCRSRSDLCSSPLRAPLAMRSRQVE